MKEESWRIECENIVNDKTIHLEIKFEDLKYLQKTLKESDNIKENHQRILNEIESKKRDSINKIDSITKISI